MTDQTALDAGELKSLADLLARAPRVVKLGQAADAGSPVEVASEAAAGLFDIRSSTEVLFGELLPKLVSLSPESSDFEDVLDDIAEEYRHINYHIANTRLFSYVVPRE
jgi:hypothetical protein